MSTRRGFAGSTSVDVRPHWSTTPSWYSSRASAGRGTRSSQPPARRLKARPAPGTTASHSSVTAAWRRSGSASRKRTHRSSTFGGSATVAAAGRDAATVAAADRDAAATAAGRDAAATAAGRDAVAGAGCAVRSPAGPAPGGVTNRSEQGVGEGAPGPHHTRVAGPDDLEQLEQVLARGVAVVIAGGPDGVDQPDEGVLDVAAEQVEVGDEDLGGDVGGCGRRGGARRLQVGAGRALHQPHLGQTQRGVGVGRVLLQRLLVGGDRPVEVVALDRLERLLVQRRERLLLVVGRLVGGSDVDAAGDPVLAASLSSSST